MTFQIDRLASESLEVYIQFNVRTSFPIAPHLEPLVLATIYFQCLPSVLTFAFPHLHTLSNSHAMLLNSRSAPVYHL